MGEGQGFSRASFSSAACRSHFARPFGPASASIRAITPASRRTSVVFVSSSRLSGGRPMRGALSDAAFSAKAILFPISLIDSVTDAAYLSDIGYGGKAMTNTLTIQGYEKNTVCAHCGRKLVHAVVTPEMGEIGAACFVSMIAAKPRAGYAGGYKPTPAAVISTAKIKEFNPRRIFGSLQYERAA